MILFIDFSSHISDCLTLYQHGFVQNGIYELKLSEPAITKAYCDMSAGGWTVFQRRLDGSEEFDRNWNDYVNGFGNRAGEYWLGLENIYFLTKEDSELYM